jgi:hypothetical protein
VINIPLPPPVASKSFVDYRTRISGARKLGAQRTAKAKIQLNSRLAVSECNDSCGDRNVEKRCGHTLTLLPRAEGTGAETRVKFVSASREHQKALRSTLRRGRDMSGRDALAS